MQKAGDLKDYFDNDNVLLANLKYCFSLNTQSLYFGVSYHLEMLLMASIGYLIAYYQFESLVLMKRKKIFCSSLFLIMISLYFIFFVFEKTNPFIKVAFFGYIFTLSICFVLGFYSISKKYKSFKIVLANFGRRSLTIYLLQNFLICTVWFWNHTTIVLQFRVFFITYCMGQISILTLSKLLTNNGIGMVESYWRRLSLKAH